MKPKVFIGSSVEGLKIANAIKTKLDNEFETTVWSDGIFKLSKNTLESLEETLKKSDYGIFVFSPDDVLSIRETKKRTVRDNVLFEFGLFIGELGRKNVFFITPEDHEDLHLPTDLLGITSGTYYNRSDNNYIAAVGSFCFQVSETIKSNHNDNYGLINNGMFQDFTYSFKSLLKKTNELTLYFIHSRSWRENNHNNIIYFLRKKSSRCLNVYLPNFKNALLMDSFIKNFSDGKYIPSLIEDAVKFFLDLKHDYPDKVNIRLYNFYPSYSFYKFDTVTVLALYPTTDRKKNVPTFIIENHSEYYNFINDDYQILEQTSERLSEEHINKIKEN